MKRDNRNYEAGGVVIVKKKVLPYCSTLFRLANSVEELRLNNFSARAVIMEKKHLSASC